MEDNEVLREILRELQRSRRASASGLSAALLLLLVVCAFAVFRFVQISRTFDTSLSETSVSMRQGDFDKALKEARTLTARNPQYHKAHQYLGEVYLAKGDLASAEKAYARAYELMPTEDTAFTLKEIRARLVKAHAQ